MDLILYQIINPEATFNTQLVTLQFIGSLLSSSNVEICDKLLKLGLLEKMHGFLLKNSHN